MHPRPPSARRGLIATTVLALLAALLVTGVWAPSPARANPGGTNLVISEVYSAGNQGGAAYTADFVELYNPTDSAIYLAGLALQYRQGPTGAAVVPLSGGVAAGSHFLVQMSAAGSVPANGDAALPTPDLVASPAVPLGGPSGQIFLTTSTTPFPDGTQANVAGNAALIDMVGYGTAGTFETANTGVTLTEDTSAARSPGPGTDTDHNANDFVEGTPTPEQRLVVASSVSGTAAAFPYGTVGTVTATVVPADATGAVSLYNGATLLGSGTLSAGTASIAIPARTLAPGTNSLEVRYPGDAIHAPSTGAVSVEVVKATPFVAATATPDTVAVGQSTSVGVNVTATGFTPTGTVQAWVDGALEGSATLVSGAATIAVGPFDTMGDSDIEVHYLGDQNANPATDTVTVSVVAAAATVTATATPDSVTVLQGTTSVGVTVSATGLTPTGTVEAWVDGALEGSATLVAGAATIAVGPFDTAGDTDIEVRYLGDANASAATDTVTVEVVKLTPTMTVAKTPKRVVRNKTKARLTIRVSEATVTPTGSVTVRVDGKLLRTRALTNGRAVVTLKKFAKAGRHTVKVVYNGDATHKRVQKNLTIKVKRR